MQAKARAARFLHSAETSSGRIVGILPFDYSDWPIVWRWMVKQWDTYADDAMLQDLPLFLRLKEEQNAVNLAVYVDDEFGGVLMCEPKSPWLCQAHVVFRPEAGKGFWGAESLTTALELGKRFAWEAGYRKIAALTFARNRLICKLIERVGGHLEGVFERETYQHKEPATLVRYGIFREG